MCGKISNKERGGKTLKSPDPKKRGGGGDQRVIHTRSISASVLAYEESPGLSCSNVSLMRLSCPAVFVDIRRWVGGWGGGGLYIKHKTEPTRIGII